ncbi:MAG: Glycerophosphocholine phosphodiesterase [Alectoria fallacina]|uniref:Glycerophosphocholine phosphodiesterase n=1 Tax=Alectoria fallacina TaxID=1903189 RepID=A0A8H3FYG3_9LECA|nr:MAG: Glycerophosphocholine phosphodiesterase [Alectoria fallacina]
MKFGRNLPRNQVPEWSTSYIQYKALKKLIKSAGEEAKRGDGADTAEFFYSLDRNLEDVDQFYNKKYGDAVRRLKLLHDRYGRSLDTANGIDEDEKEDLMGALLELRGQLRKLKWYGETNRQGFVKITKKLDKKLGQTATQRRYLESKVDPKQFATNYGLVEATNTVNDWLEKLGDIRIRDDNSSTHSSRSLRRASSKAMLALPAAILDSVDQAIRADDAQRMTKLLSQRSNPDHPNEGLPPILTLNLLQRAISCRAKACIDQLLAMIDTLDAGDDINKRNCIHRLVITNGRSKSSGDGEPTTEATQNGNIETTNYIKPAAPPVLVNQLYSTKEHDGIGELSRDDKAIVLLEYLLDRLRPQQRMAIQARDVYERMPLHYAAQYGCVALCQIIISRMQAWGRFETSHRIDAPFSQDADGYSPLHLSVIGGHPQTTRTLLEAEDWRGANGRKAAVRKPVSKSGEVLALAVKANFVVIVKLLAEAGVDLDYQDDQGETALHVAARFGHTECAKILLEERDGQKADMEVTENSFGWTPLFIACVDGHIDIVRILIAAKADLERLDTSGWTAKEHAALRGHMDIAEILADVIALPSPSELDLPSVNPLNAIARNKSLAERKSNATTNGNGNGTLRRIEPIKTYGHRYLTKETMILVSLGTMDTRKVVEAVNLDRIPLADAHSTQLDTALSIVVSASGANGEPSIIDLPVQDNISTDPIVFTALDATKVKLLFDIVPTYAGSNDQRVGRGVALLSSVKPSVGSKRITLQGDLAVPIMAASTLEVIGSVNFNFLIITPFTHPNMTIAEDLTYWKSMASTMVIGHRGLGKNTAARNSLQLGENTIQSFIAAANLGAQYIEFDVQLTKDHVPVIYHDFLVSETGIDAPVHALTLEQFLHVNDDRGTPRSSRPSSPVSAAARAIKGSDQRKHRSMSLGDLTKDGTSNMSERMKNTKDFKKKGFKANSRGNFIQAPFTTLEEMFIKLPQHIGFNIEMKYPMLHESEEQEMDTYAVELNSFVDEVLTKVYDLGKKRNVIFSSFNPDICLLLSFKQPSIPILFLTDAGTSVVSDIRASSLQEAIRFASRWNLLGVVSAAEPLVIAPRLVKVVKESGLVCVSYGGLNNDPQNVKVSTYQW